MDSKDELSDFLRGPVSRAVRNKLDQLEKTVADSYRLDRKDIPGEGELDIDILQRSVWVVLQSMMDCIRTGELTPEAAAAAGFEPKADGGVLDINVNKLLKARTAADALLSLYYEHLARKARS